MSPGPQMPMELGGGQSSAGADRSTVGDVGTGVGFGLAGMCAPPLSFGHFPHRWGKLGRPSAPLDGRSVR